MEFIALSRYFPGHSGTFIPTYGDLRAIRPVLLTHDLRLVDDPGNITYAKELSRQGLAIAPVRRSSALGGVTDGSFPQRILFEMTSECNTNCRMCPSRNMSRAKKHMETGKYLEAIDEIDTHGVQGLWLFHIGESLLHPDFFTILSYIGEKRNLGTIWFSSNGILMTEENVQRLLNSKLGFMQISLQSLSRETYAEIAPDTPFDMVMKNIEATIDLVGKHTGERPFFRLQTIEQSYNRHELDDFLARYYDKCDIISINLIEYQSLGFNHPSARPISDRKGKKCSRILNDFFLITSDGAVSICDEAFNHEYDIGNIWNNSISEIWNGDERKRFVKMNESGELWNLSLCRVCEDYNFG